MALYQQSFSVFSTYVEVILKLLRENVGIKGFLHVCGGDPKWLRTLTIQNKFSPRMWRWSYDARDSTLMINVFSTYVEVILNARLVVRLNLCFLHVCGGDPVISIANPK